MEAHASLPNHVVIPLVSIGDWDFRWQDVYRYATPVRLPRGATITMRFVYDNSAQNPRNPSHPPQRVVWGQNTTDEMGDLWVQLVPRVDAEFATLARDVADKARAEDLRAYTKLLNQEPESALRHDAVALLYLQGGDAERAASHFRESIRLNPKVAATHYNLGLALTRGGRVDEGREWLDRAQRLRSVGYSVTYGTGYLEQGRYAEALASTGAEPDLVDRDVPRAAFTPEPIVAPRPAAASAQSPFGRQVTEADLGPETFGICCHFEKRGTGALEQEREQSFLVLPHQRDQVMGNTENDMIVPDRQ
jgi:hypothetical protein